MSTRREFLSSSAGLGALALLSNRAWPQEPAPKTAPPTTVKNLPFKISLAEWSLHRALFAHEIDHLDFARLGKREYGIEALEYVNVFFPDKARDEKYLAEMNKRCADEGVRSLLIMIDREGELANADDAGRELAIENHHKWLDAAKALGCHSIRVNAAGTGERDEVAKRAADSLHRLAVRADAMGLNVIVENHGGISSDGSWLAGVMKLADHPRVGTLPDFGNFDLGDGKSYDRYRGVSEMMPFAKAVSAKSHEFDAEGNEVRTDFRRMLRIVVDAGYHGFLGVEYEGDKHSEPDGIRLTKALLERVRAEL